MKLKQRPGNCRGLEGFIRFLSTNGMLLSHHLSFATHSFCHMPLSYLPSSSIPLLSLPHLYVNRVELYLEIVGGVKKVMVHFASGKLVLSLLPSLLAFFAFLYFPVPSVISPSSMANNLVVISADLEHEDCRCWRFLHEWETMSMTVKVCSHLPDLPPHLLYTFSSFFFFFNIYLPETVYSRELFSLPSPKYNVFKCFCIKIHQ